MTVALARPRGARLRWMVAADAAVAALACAELLRGDARSTATWLLIGVAVIAVAVDLLARLGAATRGGSRTAALRTSGIVAAALAVIAAGAWLIGGELAAVLVATFAGLALVAQWLVGVVEAGDEEPAPWRALTAASALPAPTVDLGSGEPGSAVGAGSAGAATGAGLGSGDASARRWRAAGALAGAALLVMVAFWVLASHAASRALGADGATGDAVGLVVVIALVLLVAGPVLLAWQAGSRRERGVRVRAEQRQAVAAHLHDSVLQTLALIQRSAADPDRVRQLARRQERGLRTWLAGGDEQTAGTLAAAVQVAADQVEDESGATIECVITGDLPGTDRTHALSQAAREAMRNAVRHGRGPFRVLIDVEPGAVTVFVRDHGPGFDLAGVPAERGGVRDAMIGRMRSVGGTVAIDSGAAGTEVVLRLPLGDA